MTRSSHEPTDPALVAVAEHTAPEPPPRVTREIQRAILQELRALRELMQQTRDDSAVTLKEAMRRLACGRSKLYELIGNGVLQTVKHGRACLVTVDSIRSALEPRTEKKPRVTKPPLRRAPEVVGAALRKVTVE